ncbi:MAG: hypothetical protein GX542_11120 [Rhodococcus sp.]|nr:hypothetical protein [Rhodococcus sp. (in: high G+C Gram-positive bacteria)]
MSVLGDHARCSSDVEVLLETDAERPGTLFLTLIPLGAHGTGPEWAANPVCDAKLRLERMDGVFPFSHSEELALSIGPERGEPIRKEIATSSGLIHFTAFAVTDALFELPPRVARPYAGYFLVP